MKATTVAIILSVGILGAAIIFSRGGGNTEPKTITAPKENNVTIVDGKQIIEIDAKGGYLPRKSVAKAGIPTIIKFNTANTFDCSSSIRIPSMKISQGLPSSGSTDIDVGTPSAGPLEGSCGMGMYPFEVDFQP